MDNVTKVPLVQYESKVDTNKNNVPTDKLMLDISQTAERWSISKHYARQLALSGKVKAVRIGKGKILINQNSIEEYFNTSYLTTDNTPMRMCSAKEDDMNVLIAKQFVIPFESGIVVIKHWKIHNYIRSDRYKL